jgi:hypothetical protein
MSWFLTLSLAAALSADPATAAKPPAGVVAPSPAAIAANFLAGNNRRVRGATPRLTKSISQGIGRSRTFATLVNDIHQTNVIVYVEATFGLPPDVAGRILFAGTAGAQRYLRVQVRATLQGDQMISVIAHELRHALEVAGEASVVDEKGLAEFYKRIGDSAHSGGGYDTEAARVAQRIVRNELVS